MRRSTPPVPTLLPRSPFASWRTTLLWAALFFAGANAQVYNPTRLLRNGSRVYIFQPSSGSSSRFQLDTIDISSRIGSSEPSITTLYSALPFLDLEEERPFNPILDDGGNITVYTGDCTSGARGGEVWTFEPDVSEQGGNGSWRQEDITFAQDGKHVADIGPNYLSAGVSFSAIVAADALSTHAYFFGGMCPSQGGDNADWQANANYSNYMVTLDPSKITAGSLEYQLGASTSRGPPIAEAGFTLTGLSPSYSNRSDGTQTQQQNFVLVGGHTNTAFINTSQVALFSLPQQGWTFVPVNQPDTTQTDLAIRADVSAVESRSGHSAVLSDDGQHVIVFGGWIGDTNTPASPQLAVLNVGDGYGGEGDWEWTVPSTSGSGLPTSAGIYGHGAAMLPGGVMMVMGGHSISASSSRRRGASTSNGQRPMFLNMSSYTWTTDYSPPPEIHTEQPANSGPLATTGQKAGLGVGLGIGMAAVLSLMAFYIFYTRKLRRQREFRESQLNELAMGAHRYTLSPGFDGQDGQGESFQSAHGSQFHPSASSLGASSWERTKAHNAERTGLLVDIPSPTRGLRRGSGGKANHGGARYDDRRVRGSGHIHPIDEEEEQEHDEANDKSCLTSQPEMRDRGIDRGHSIFDNVPSLDPFVQQHRLRGDDGAFHSAPVSPVRDERDDHRDDHHSWQAVAGAHLPGRSSPTNHGRVSPSKSSERTGSDLSERSTFSNLPSHSHGENLGRSASVRSAAIINHAVNANPFKTPDASPTLERGTNIWQTAADPRTRSMTSIRSNARSTTAREDADSFTTARSSFMVLQAEGEALLGGNPERTRPNTSSTSNGSNSQSNHTESSMGRGNIITVATSTTEGFTRHRRKSWLGSVRRALARSTSTSDRTRSMTAATMHFESYTDNPFPEPVEPRPTIENRKSMPASSTLPRRAASDASFWHSKRGRLDWLEDEIAQDPNDPRAKWKRHPGDDWGTPEDVELAERERLRREWRERGTLLINLTDEDRLPTPTTPIGPGQLGTEGERERPRTPADEDEWDVEAAVERRVVQVMFTVPKSKLRVVNADVAETSSLLSLPRENSKESMHGDGEEGEGKHAEGRGAGSPSRVRHLAGRFEQLMSSSPSPQRTRTSPRPSPSPAASIRSVKLRGRRSVASLDQARSSSSSSSRRGSKSKGKGRAGE
ncbi:hypothetical protein PMIN06_004537 [Paraphaeosphaeria minitans]|uniref:Galactose oxidase n=1 Tax=Paraphaeosphaeria minitans TaxID=565426 RepID=A0A9P6GP34_9PLEO|nr:hypothetical protein PMIN01_04094 [Paraphaeosphaeria minitans]